MVRTVLARHTRVVRLDAVPFLGIEPKPGTTETLHYQHPLSVAGTNYLAFLVRKLGLPGREEPLQLVVVAGFGPEPLLLLTNLCGVRDSQSLWWIVQIYLTRWKIEETFRFVKQSYHLEDIRVLRCQRLKNLV